MDVVLVLLGAGRRGASISSRSIKTLDALAGFKHRFNDAEDVACLLVFIRGMRRTHGSIEGFFAPGGAVGDLRPALADFVRRTLALPRDGLYGRGCCSPRARKVRFSSPLPHQGKRLQAAVSLPALDGSRGTAWIPGRESRVKRSSLLIPLDAHIINIGRKAGSPPGLPGWKMAEDITATLRACDPEDPLRPASHGCLVRGPISPKGVAPGVEARDYNRQEPPCPAPT